MASRKRQLVTLALHTKLLSVSVMQLDCIMHSSKGLYLRNHFSLLYKLVRANSGFAFTEYLFHTPFHAS